tara:strand:- start:12120 stop:12974 length:855 start_codon:yes stop_codon:yes gene_type:complete
MSKIYLFLLVIISSQRLNAGTLNHPNFFFQNSLWDSLNTKVRFCRIDSQYITKKMKKKLKIHFKEDEYVVNPMYQKKIISFIDEIKDGLDSIKMSAHADMCGTAEYNKKLSWNRARAVYDEIAKIITFTSQIPVDVKGEAESHDHGKNDRFVEIEAVTRPKQNANYQGIVLIDASVSAGNNPTASGIYWWQMPELKFKDNTLVYIVRSSGAKCYGTDLKDYKPEGYTVFKQARHLINQHAVGKMHISIISDGKQHLLRRYSDRAKRFEKKVKKSKQSDLTFSIW